MIKIENIPSALLCLLLLTQASTLATDKDARGNNSCLPSERAALLSLKAGFIDPKNRLSSWKGYHCCHWIGVTCNNATGHVVILDLGTNHPRDSIIYGEWSEFFDGSYHLGGEIRSSILSLQYLNYLNLSHNMFCLSKIPEFIGSLKELRYLDLHSANFGDKIPPQLGNLSNLQYLDLSHNSVFSNDVAWLAHLFFLNHLDLSAVNLSRAINLEKIGMLPHLQTLHLSECGLNETSFPLLSHVNFTELVTFDLSANEFSNPLSFNWVWNITCLKYLDFSSNNFDGRLPNALRNMNSLEELHLGWNNLMDMKASDLKKLTNLKVLELREAQVTGDITEFIEGFSPYGLQSLDLGWNSLHGNLSSWIGRMTSLTTLVLLHNSLSGPISLSIRRLTQLNELILSHNNFHGVITGKHLSKLTNLEIIDLSNNSLSLNINVNWWPPFRLRGALFSSCSLGPKFPEWLKWQTHIDSLDISNTSISDTVPVWFWYIFAKTYHLNLSKNNLSGQLPRTLEFMSAVRIDLQDNNFHGRIPILPKSLYTINLSKNTLSGRLSFNFEGKNQLRVLVLRENSFNGSIPQSLCKLQYLQYLDLSKNSLMGNVPHCMNKNINLTSLQSLNRFCLRANISSLNSSIRMLNLGYNNLSGRFPRFLKECNNLVLLALQNNNFSGSIPTWVGKRLTSLRILSLRFNRFSGPIPSELAELSQLQVLDLGQNDFSGHISHSLRTLKQMVHAPNFYVSDDKHRFWLKGYTNKDPFWVESEPQFLTSELIGSLDMGTKGLELEYGDGIKYWTSFDLSCNNLTGDMPEDIGFLTALMNLNLSRNKLSGNIPKNIGSVQLLESLDLSNNEFSGTIPSSLSALNFLSYLNLSHNNLSGKIPSGHQLQALDDPSIYEGNPGLCGFPLLIECPKGNTTEPTISKMETDDGRMHFYVGATVGFIIGICLVYGGLFMGTWRVAYFRYFDNLYDRIYVFVSITWTEFTRKSD